METKSLFTIFKTEKQKNQIILNNTLLMLSNRIYIDPKDPKGEKRPVLDLDNLKQHKVTDKGDNTYTLTANTGDDYVLKIVYHKITSAGKQSIISEFIKEFTKYKKILVAHSYNNKIADIVTRQGIQIFRESSLLQDIISYRDQPKFELLSPKEMEAVKAEYNITDYTTKKVLKNDPVVKYFGLNKGDIYRIIRPSPTSGEAVDYRIVMQ